MWASSAGYSSTRPGGVLRSGVGGDAGSDRNGKIEGEEALATLGFAADDADGALAPEPIDEPAL